MKCKILFVLTIVLAVYLCAGAALFRFIESGQEDVIREELKQEIAAFLESNQCVNQSQLFDFLNTFHATAGQYFTSATTNISKVAPKWDYPGAFTFAVTIVTTIGYGHIYPVTFWGRTMTVIFAFLGIPLMLIFLDGLGSQLSKLSHKASAFNVTPDSPTLNKVLNLTVVIIAGIVVMFIIPSVVFVFSEKWSIEEAVYYCFTTLSTIGFGDLVAGATVVYDNEVQQTIYQVSIYLWIIIGLAYLSLSIKVVSAIFIQRAEQAKKEALKRVNLKQLSMKADAVVGGLRNLEDMAIQHTNPKKSSTLFGGAKNRGVVRETLTLDEDNNVTLVSVSTVEKF